MQLQWTIKLTILLKKSESHDIAFIDFGIKVPFCYRIAGFCLETHFNFETGEWIPQKHPQCFHKLFVVKPSNGDLNVVQTQNRKSKKFEISTQFP